jgi:hypothetical protein
LLVFPPPTPLKKFLLKSHIFFVSEKEDLKVAIKTLLKKPLNAPSGIADGRKPFFKNGSFRLTRLGPWSPFGLLSTLGSI